MIVQNKVRKMNEYNQAGSWPANAIHDMKQMRGMLREDGYEDADFVFVAHYKVLRELEQVIHGGDRSYGEWLLEQRILYSILMNNTLNENEGIFFATKCGIPFIKVVEGLYVVPKNSIIRFNFLQNEGKQDE